MTEPYKKCTDADDSTAASLITSAGTVLVSPSDGWLGPWDFDADTLAEKMVSAVEWRSGWRVGLITQRSQDRNLAPLFAFGPHKLQVSVTNHQ